MTAQVDGKAYDISAEHGIVAEGMTSITEIE